MMKKRLMLITALIFSGEAIAMEELLVYVPPDEAQAVIERNEMQYEELRWHSLPNRIRIATINTELLTTVGKTFQISPFQEVLPIVIRSLGVDGIQWTGTKQQGAKSEAEIAEASKGDSAVADIVRGISNTAQLRVEKVARHDPTGEYFPVAAGRGASQERGADQVFADRPYSDPNAKVVTKVYGTITVSPLVGGQGQVRSYSIKALQHDPEYVVIYEWDSSKDHHLMDPPHDPEAFEQSELGQKFKALREDKNRHMQEVADRIAERNRKATEARE